MCAFGLVKFEIYSFLENVRTKMNDIYIMGDCRHVPQPHSASNVNLALH